MAEANPINKSDPLGIIGVIDEDASGTMTFVRKRPGKDGGQPYTDFWTTLETGNYGFDCALGSGLASEFFEYIDDSKDPLILNGVLGEMIKKGKYGPVEIGFIDAISRRLVARERCA